MTSQFRDDELSMPFPLSPGERQSNQNGSSAHHHRSDRREEPKRTVVPTDSRTGQRIGQYQIIKTLGEGSFGKVKLATHKQTGQQVALKIIPRKKLISRDMAGRVEREIQYLQLLRHPHIIKLYTVITTPIEIIMVLEFAGGELFDYIVKNGKMSEDKARRFFQQIVCAVEYCHRHKIVHRDLKPENLLLDDDLNVKIADFGLSNIMTDGNFLKTSCGSPNYAAPEVISGKLYAGPEVDVWSCGIILYVLLVGRLPFDDEFIPNLFRKINSGNYITPSYLSSGAKQLIAKMLKVNPVQRITIAEIRQDPWFLKDLQPYLIPAVEEFVDTGVDPNKAIDPQKVAPTKPPEVQQKIHDKIIGKLGKTLGYAKDDVQEALEKTEPNAIKDAYLIVRESQIMQTNPSLSTDPDLQPWLATSPPAWNVGTPVISNFQSPTSTTPLHYQTPASKPRLMHADSNGSEQYVSKIGILATSIPYLSTQYHTWKTDDTKRKQEQRERIEMEISKKQSQGLDLNEAESAYLAKLEDKKSKERTSADENATREGLRPHSRSSIQLQQMASQAQEKKEKNKDDVVKKNRTRWQFGIRSRNSPHEAMHCVYKALASQGARWEMPPPQSIPPGAQPGTFPVHVKGTQHIEDESHHNFDQYDGPIESRHSAKQESRKEDCAIDSGESDDQMNSDADDHSINPHELPEDYIPKDPWCIKVRWLKTGMYPPGTVHPSSANTSRLDLTTAGSPLSSAATSSTSIGQGGFNTNLSHSTGQSSTATVQPDAACYVYMDVQLYTLELPSENKNGTFLVDFKCAGYEALVRQTVSDTESILVGSGVRVLDKDVTSPQPFLDLTNRLVICLAGGGG
ncbi:Protein kinase [Agyrium rufum]|nr:Protein kinase [Agyrium rufum]